MNYYICIHNLLQIYEKIVKFMIALKTKTMTTNQVKDNQLDTPSIRFYK